MYVIGLHGRTILADVVPKIQKEIVREMKWLFWEYSTNMELISTGIDVNNKTLML